MSNGLDLAELSGRNREGFLHSRRDHRLECALLEGYLIADQAVGGLVQRLADLHESGLVQAQNSGKSRIHRSRRQIGAEVVDCLDQRGTHLGVLAVEDLDDHHDLGIAQVLQLNLVPDQLVE